MGVLLTGYTGTRSCVGLDDVMVGSYNRGGV